MSEHFRFRCPCKVSAELSFDFIYIRNVTIQISQVAVSISAEEAGFCLKTGFIGRSSPVLIFIGISKQFVYVGNQAVRPFPVVFDECRGRCIRQVLEWKQGTVFMTGINDIGRHLECFVRTSLA